MCYSRHWYHVQGGAVNRGLLFTALPPPQLGGCERKDKQNPLDGCLSDDVNVAAKMGGTPVAVETANHYTDFVLIRTI
jgi:hypothetical protein